MLNMVVEMPPSIRVSEVFFFFPLAGGVTIACGAFSAVG